MLNFCQLQYYHKKDAFYFYKANWNPAPMVYITERRFYPRPIADAPIKIYSNCDDVELKVNEKSLGPATGNDVHVFVWPTMLLNSGKNKLEAIGTRGGKTFTDQCTIVVDQNAIDGKSALTGPTTGK